MTKLRNGSACALWLALAACRYDPLPSLTADAPAVDAPTDAAPGGLALQAYIKASTPGMGDNFSRSVALSADGLTLAVGATGEGSAASGINANQADDSAPEAGAVYVFTRSGTTWTQQAYLKASNPEPTDWFGYSVALSADGSTLAVGAIREDSAATGVGGNPADNSASDAGAVYVFTRSVGIWSQQAYVKMSSPGAGDLFGGSVALSADGSTLAVGAAEEDSAAVGINGNDADNSLSNAGAVYVFTRSGTTWSQQAYVKASNTGSNDSFGCGVALSADGSILAVGANEEDSPSSGSQGDGLSNAGAVYVFTRSGTTWSQQAYVKASNPGTTNYFGSSVALSADGLTLAAGAIGEASYAGAAYVFTRSGTTWSQQASVKASSPDADDSLGDHVALSADGSTLAAGAIAEDSAAIGIGGDQAGNTASDSGAIYLFTRSGTTWSQQAYVKASNTGVGDAFGSSVALSADGSILVGGAISEDSAATGIGGNQADNSLDRAGAVYVYLDSGAL